MSGCLTDCWSFESHPHRAIDISTPLDPLSPPSMPTTTMDPPRASATTADAYATATPTVSIGVGQDASSSIAHPHAHAAPSSSSSSSPSHSVAAEQAQRVAASLPTTRPVPSYAAVVAASVHEGSATEPHTSGHTAAESESAARAVQTAHAGAAEVERRRMQQEAATAGSDSEARLHEPDAQAYADENHDKNPSAEADANDKRGAADKERAADDEAAASIRAAANRADKAERAESERSKEGDGKGASTERGSDDAAASQTDIHPRAHSSPESPTARAAALLAQQLTEFHLAHQRAAASRQRADSSPPAIMAASTGGQLREERPAHTRTFSSQSRADPHVLLDLPVAVAPPPLLVGTSAQMDGSNRGDQSGATQQMKQQQQQQQSPAQQLGAHLSPVSPVPPISVAPASPSRVEGGAGQSWVPMAPFPPFSRMRPVEVQDAVHGAEALRAEAEYEAHRESILKQREERRKQRMQHLKEQKEFMDVLDNMDKAESDRDDERTNASDASHSKDEPHSGRQRRLQHERPQAIGPIVQSPSEQGASGREMALVERPMQFSKEPDVILNIPDVSVGLISLEVNNLAARVDVHAQVRDTMHTQRHSTQASNGIAAACLRSSRPPLLSLSLILIFPSHHSFISLLPLLSSPRSGREQACDPQRPHRRVD